MRIVAEIEGVDGNPKLFEFTDQRCSDQRACVAYGRPAGQREIRRVRRACVGQSIPIAEPNMAAYTRIDIDRMRLPAAGWRKQAVCRRHRGPAAVAKRLRKLRSDQMSLGPLRLRRAA